MFHKGIQGNLKENLAVYQKSLGHFFHEALQLVSKETVVLYRWASETLSYQHEVAKGKLTAVASFEKADVSSVSPSLEQRVLRRIRVL